MKELPLIPNVISEIPPIDEVAIANQEEDDYQMEVEEEDLAERNGKKNHTWEVHDGHSEEQSLRPVHHGQLLPLWKGQKQGTLDESIITHRTVDMQRSLEENPCCGCTP